MTAEEFNTCVDLHADSLYCFILNNIGDKDKAKDIVQDTYEKLWQKITDVPSKNAKSYMFTTAYRTMVDVIRRDKKQTSFDQINEYNHVHEKQYSDLKSILNNGLKQLSEIQRSVIMLRDYEGYDYAEIGNITGLNESQVKVYIYRARLFLKEYIGKIGNVI